MKYFAVIILLAVTMGQFRPEEREPNPKMVIKWKMTEFLDITEKQAEKFFPRVNALEKELKVLRDMDQNLHKELNDMLDDGSVNSNKVDNIIDELYSIEEKRMRLKKDHIKSMDDVLTPEQRAKYVAFERSFRHRLKDKLRDKKHRRGEHRKGIDRRWD